jgi:hypothetical protein
MTITYHRSKKYDTPYYKVGSRNVAECDVMNLWKLMCGEDAIKEFLLRCEKDDEYPDMNKGVPVFTVAELKKETKT